MCLNIGLGFMEIPDTPLSMPDHYGNCGAQYEAAVGDGGMVPIGDLMDRGIGNGTAGFSDITEEMRQPTNATATQGAGDPTGGGEPFNQITEAIEASYKTMETMKNFVTGGYVMNVVGNLNLQCDNQPALASIADCDYAWGTESYTPITYSFPSGASKTFPCENPTFGEPISSPVWDYFRGGFEVAITFLIATTLFYFITGRGTFLSN